MALVGLTPAKQCTEKSCGGSCLRFPVFGRYTYGGKRVLAATRQSLTQGTPLVNGLVFWSQVLIDETIPRCKLGEFICKAGT